MADDPPAAAEPQTASSKPPEGIRDHDEARVISIAPDVCLTPCGSSMVAIPYNIIDYHGHDQNYTPTVRLNGYACMVLRSITTHVHGDEAGTGGGVKSGTHGGICEPIGHEPTVRSEGSPVIRDGDLCWMNNRNTIGKCVLVKSTEINQIPRPKPKSWWQATKDYVGQTASDAATAISDFDKSHGAILTRTVGVAQAVGGGVETLAGGAAFTGGTAADATGVGAVVGVPAQIGGGALVANGIDNFVAGVRTAWTGEFQKTGLQTAVGGGLQAVGAPPSVVTAGEIAAGLGPGGIKSVATVTGRIVGLGKTAEELPALARASEEAPALLKAPEAVAPEQPALVAAVNKGVRASRIKSLRERYLGRTPGKKSRTGRKVIERMEEEGKIRTDLETGAKEFKDSKGNWHDLSEADMAHKTDAVTWWNQTGRQYGALSPEVRAFMLNPDNYYLELYSINRSQGSILGQSQKYLPPLK